MGVMAQSDLKRVGRAARNVAKSREELRVAIVLAHDAGETFEDIGREAGVTRQRAQQIARESRAK